MDVKNKEQKRALETGLLRSKGVLTRQEQADAVKALGRPEKVIRLGKDPTGIDGQVGKVYDKFESVTLIKEAVNKEMEDHLENFRDFKKLAAQNGKSIRDFEYKIRDLQGDVKKLTSELHEFAVLR